MSTETGFEHGQQDRMTVLVQPSQLSSLGSYLGTVVAGTVVALGPPATYVGAAVYSPRDMAIFRDVRVIGIPSDTMPNIFNVVVVGFGRTLGTVISTVGTLAPATNNVIVRFFSGPATGTVLGTIVSVADASKLVGTLSAIVSGR